MSAGGVPVSVFYRNSSGKKSGAGHSFEWKNQPQMYGLTAGVFILISGGMGLAQGLGWNLNTFFLTTLHFQFCWFIGAIIGVIIAAPLITVLPKKVYFLISSTLVIVGGIIFTSAPYNYNGILAARYLNGIATGFATVPFLVLAGESAVYNYRGTCLSMEQYSIAFGIAIQVIYSSQWSLNIDFPANRLHGIFDLIFGVCALAGTFLIIESPIYYLLKCNEPDALESLIRLERPQIVTVGKQALLQELKLYVLESENHGMGESFMIGLWPLLKMCLYRGLVALSFSLPLSAAIELSSLVSLATWAPILYGMLRVLGTLITVGLSDARCRKLIALLSLLCAASMVLGVGIIFSDVLNILNSHQMSIVCSLSLVHQLFAGMFVPSSSVYLGEAFPLLVKPYLIACTLTVEYLVHITIICAFDLSANSLYVFALCVAVMSYAFILLFLAVLPETTRISLQEAEHRFRCLMETKVF